MAHINSDILRLGVDVGSTTVKAVALDPADNSVLFTRYQRHNAHQADAVRQLLEEAAGHFPGMRFRIGVCGSGGRPIAAALGACYVQEVVANAAAVRALYPEVRTAVELGGQDAKVIFFRYDEASGKLQTSDMRMNGSCAGGTGAFIDEIATLLNVPADEFEQLAARGKTVYSISGRCGVFAKSDVQPLLNQGASKNDVALSIFGAVVNQTIAGLAQGRPIRGKVLAQADIPDETFAQGILGPGCGIEPTGKTVYAPFDGTVEQVASTLHAVGLTSEDGIEILIHVGMDTVEMQGKGFKALVKVGDKVKAGTPLLKVDLEAIRAAGHPTATALIVTNSDDLPEISVAANGDAAAGTPVFLSLIHI